MLDFDNHLTGNKSITARPDQGSRPAPLLGNTDQPGILQADLSIGTCCIMSLKHSMIQDDSQYTKKDRAIFSKVYGYYLPFAVPAIPVKLLNTQRSFVPIVAL